jgi:thymidylate synthase (FAD)
MFDFIKVRMVGVTVPTLDEIPDSEGLVSYTARVSNEGNQTNFDTAAGLLRYCMRENHVSVFEMANIVMEIEAPRDIARQILRHRSFSFQEFSQRYAEATNFTTRECRLQDEKNRQNSIESEDHDLNAWWEDEQLYILGEIESLYKQALKNGIAKEVARCILPEGLTMSKMYMNGTVRSWIHYCQLREKNGTQLEHQDVAVKAKQEILSKFPFLSEVMEK